MMKALKKSNTFAPSTGLNGATSITGWSALSLARRREANQKGNPMKLAYMTKDKRRRVESVTSEAAAVQRLAEIPNLMGGTLYDPKPCKSWDCQSGSPVHVNP